MSKVNKNLMKIRIGRYTIYNNIANLNFIRDLPLGAIRIAGMERNPIHRKKYI